MLPGTVTVRVDRAQLLALQIFLEELQRPGPGILRRLWTVAILAHVAEKCVGCVGINFIVVRLAGFFHFLCEPRHLRGDRFIEFAIIPQDWCGNVLDCVEILGNLSVKYDARCQVLVLSRE